MDNKKLRKIFSSKKFLRKNEFAALLGQGTTFAKENKKLVIFAVVVLVVLGLSLPLLNWYKINRVNSFNTALYTAEKSLEKEVQYKKILETYGSLPASQFARLKLVDSLLSHQKAEDAVQVINEGLEQGDRNIFQTILILKQVNLLKEQGLFEEAAKFIAKHEKSAIKPFLGQLKIIQGDLLILANKKEEARKVYDFIARFSANTEGQKDAADDYDAAASKTAKEKLLLLDLGVL